jgi:hypothetical protein
MRFNRPLLTYRNISALFVSIDGKKKHREKREKRRKNHVKDRPDDKHTKNGMRLYD